MEATTTNSVMHHVRRAILLHDGASLTDGRLLDLFIEDRDDDAFAALVRRHGPMVWGVCRRLLNRHDAEDAFQATFLVLVRKAASVLPREQVGNWLYGVARQTALQARRTTAKRQGREKQVAEMPEPAVPEDAVWRDLRLLLDLELSHLPDQYRTVLVLCDLEGNTRKEAARQLGVPEGSVAGWLARGRAMLAKRLARQGVALPAGALVTVLGGSAAGQPPTSVVGSTIKAAGGYAAGQAATTGLISVKVVVLTEGVLKAMMVSKIKLRAAVLLAVVCLGGMGAGVSLSTNSAAVAQQPGEGKGKERQPAPGKVVGGLQAPPVSKTRPLPAELHGVWTLVSGEEDGQAMRVAPGDGDDTGEKPMEFIVQRDRWIVNDGWGRGLVFRAEFVSAEPVKQIRIWGDRAEARKNGPHRLIYLLNEDKLTVCIGKDDSPPTKFTAAKGSGQTLLVLKRAD